MTYRYGLIIWDVSGHRTVARVSSLSKALRAAKDARQPGNRTVKVAINGRVVRHWRHACGSTWTPIPTRWSV